jgi:hypothetical protein
VGLDPSYIHNADSVDRAKRTVDAFDRKFYAPISADKQAQLNEFLPFTEHEAVTIFPARVPVSPGEVGLDMVDGRTRTQPRRTTELRRQRSQRPSHRLHPYRPSNSGGGYGGVGLGHDLSQSSAGGASVDGSDDDTFLTFVSTPASTQLVGDDQSSTEWETSWPRHDEELRLNSYSSMTAGLPLPNQPQTGQDQNMPAWDLQTNSALSDQSYRIPSHSHRSNPPNYDYFDMMPSDTYQ